ncbi:hypothetical protein D3C80_1767450 [compost metagenome]
MLAGLGGVSNQRTQGRRLTTPQVERADKVAEGQDEAEQRRNHDADPRRRHHHQQHRSQSSAAEVVRRLDQRTIDVHQAEQLQQNHQWQAQREITDISTERRIQHGKRLQPELTKRRIEDAVIAEEHLP